jgi:hypothetical protein
LHMSNPNTYTITLEPLPEGPPAEIRIRRLLKIALRMLGLKCVNVTETNTPNGFPSAPSVRESAAGGLTAGASPAITITRQTAGEKSSV